MAHSQENDYGFAKYLFEYIEYLNDSNVVNAKLSDASIFILSHFIKYEKLSVYDIQKLLKETGHSADYRNLHNKIKEFESLSLIRKTEQERYSGRKALYYNLTSAGIFYLLCNYSMNNLKPYYRNILINIVEDNFIFNLFLSNLIERKTLRQISSSSFQFLFVRHFMRILKEIEKEVEILYELINTGQYAEKYCKWGDLLGYNHSEEKKNETSNKIINYWYPQIKNSTDSCDFLFSFNDTIHHNLRMRNMKNTTDKTIKFSINKDEYIFEIDELRKSNVLLRNNVEIGTNRIQKSLNDYELYKIKYPDLHSYYSFIGSEFSNILYGLNLDLLLTILAQFVLVDSAKTKSYSKDGSICQDLFVISKDEKLRELITIFKSDIDIFITNFLSYENESKSSKCIS